MPSTMGFKEGKTKKPMRELSYRHNFRGIIPGDAAVALELALKALGWEYEEITTVIPNPYHPGSPDEIPFVRHTIDGGGEVPFGSYRIKELGEITPKFNQYETPPILTVSASLESKKVKDNWDKLVATTTELAKQSTLFRGRALLIESPDDLLVPKYMDLKTDNTLLFNDSLEDELETCIFWPLRNRELLRKEGIATKFGALLEGHYGVGKSEIAYKAAQVANVSGWGVLHMDPFMIKTAVEIARYLQPVLIEVEDIDMAASGDRDNLTLLINAFSSMVTKTDQDYALVATTNFAARLDPALMRPDRIDRFITVEPPNASTAERIITHYGGAQLTNGVAATVADHFAGITPAIIMEVTKRARIDALRKNGGITADSLLAYKTRMARQIELAQPVFREDSHADKLYKELQHVTAH